jgi:predicted Zn-dependent protease
MKKTICLLFMVMIGFGAMPACSQETERADMDELRKRADSVLSQGNVSARRDIAVVFELVDRLIEEGSGDAEHYVVEGIKHYPWNLKYQMVYAELLAKRGGLTQAREKADLVFQYGETDDLIKRARKLLGKEPLPTFDRMRSLPGSKHSVVLVPFMQADVWLLVRIKEQLSAVLGIPVHIQSIETDYPPFSRDRRGSTLNRMRKELLEDIDDYWVAKALKDLDVIPDDLDDEAKLLRVLKSLIDSDGPEAVAEFEAYLEESRGKDPQWDADQLLEVLFRAVKPYRGKNIAYLGITSADIYAEDYNFIFGCASRRGGVVSYAQFTADFNDEVPNQDRLIKRTLMQCLQSIGNIHGVESCTDPTCARAYPNSLEEHDAKKGTLCSRCRSGFENIFEQTPADDVLEAAPEQ